MDHHPLLNLPNELLLHITSFFGASSRRRAAFARTCRRLYELTILDLYRFNIEWQDASCAYWAVTANSGSLSTLKRAIDAGLDVNADACPSDFGLALGGEDEDSSEGHEFEVHFSLLHAAAMSGRDDLIGLLLDSGAAIDAPSQNFCACRNLLATLTYDTGGTEPYPMWTPLHHAICGRNVSTAISLLSLGASYVVDLSPLSQVTALHSAAEGDERAVMDYLLGEYRRSEKQGQSGLVPNVDINARTGAGFTPLHYAASVWATKNTVECLVENGADLHAIDNNGCTPFAEACLSGNFSVASRLLAAGCDPNTDANGYRPLHIAVRSRIWFGPESGLDPVTWTLAREQFLADLIAAGGDVDAKCQSTDEHSHGLTPLEVSCWSSLDGTDMDVLLKAGADVRAGDYQHPLIERLCEEWDVSYRLNKCQILLDHGGHSEFEGVLKAIHRCRGTGQDQLEILDYALNSAKPGQIKRQDIETHNWAVSYQLRNAAVLSRYDIFRRILRNIRRLDADLMTGCNKIGVEEVKRCFQWQKNLPRALKIILDMYPELPVDEYLLYDTVLAVTGCSKSDPPSSHLSGILDSIKLLVSHGVDVHWENGDGNSAFRILQCLHNGRLDGSFRYAEHVREEVQRRFTILDDPEASGRPTIGLRYPAGQL